MKRPFSLILVVAIFSCCNQQNNQYGDVPQTIIVAGKIDNYEPNRDIRLLVNRIGFENEQIVAKTDTVGNFIATFESYIPLDVVIGYKTFFYLLLHPGDSLIVHFDGNCKNSPDLLETIKFGGDRAKTNRYAAKYQQLYYSSAHYGDWERNEKSMKEYDTDKYLQYLDTIRQEDKKLYDQFVTENRPDNESKKWALLFSENRYYSRLAWYASEHRRLNNMSIWNENFWDVPIGFYDSLCCHLPLDPSMFISAHALNNFSGYFDSYVIDKLRDRQETMKNEEAEEGWRGWGILPGGGMMSLPEVTDSIRIFSVIEFVPDSLLLQIMLTQYFNKTFEKQNITVYERFQNVANMYIKEPFLKEPLHQKYFQIKSIVENPQFSTETIIKNVDNLSVKQIVDDILLQNKGKIIYVDFWATWCGPCLAEMPNSKILEHELKGQDVVFIYICLNSNENQWKATLSKLQLGGQHYFFSNKQSDDISKLFEISGIPFYLLIDKNGIINEKGSHLRPLIVKDKVKEMLK